MKFKKVKTINERAMTKNEQEEEFASSLVFSNISKSWEEIATLKAQIREFKLAKKNQKLIDIFQDLLDSYLIFVGRLEQFADKKDFIDLPKEDELKEDVNVEIKVTSDEPTNTEVKKENSEVTSTESIPVPDEEIDKYLSDDDFIDTPTDPIKQPAEKAAPEVENNDTDYYVDFDDPTGEPLSDADLYDEDGKIKA